MPRIAITGATGYIGRSAVAYFASLGWDVVSLVRHAPRGGGDAAVTVGEIDGNTDWSVLVRGFDCVLHLAGIAHLPPGSVPDTEYVRVNSEGTAALARACVTWQVPRLIFLSSLSVMQRCAETPLCETSAAAPQGPYGRSKLAAEESVRQICGVGGVEYVIFRPPMIYGPDAPGNFRRLSRLVRQGIPLPLGKAIAKRSFLGIENLLDAIVLAASDPRAGNGTFMLSDGEDVSAAELVGLMAESLGRKAIMPAVPARLMAGLARLAGKEDDIRRLFEPLQVDASLWRRTLAWLPPVSLKAGISAAMKAGAGK